MTTHTTLPLATLRQPSWARLPEGSKVNDPANATEGLHSVGLYDVELRPLYIDDPDDGTTTMRLPKHKALVRTDTGEVFDVVGKDYQIVTPSLFSDLLDEHVTGLPLETFAHLRGGRQQLAVYRLSDFAVLGDEISSHLLFINDLSGSRAMRVVVGNVRLLCINGQVHYDANGVGKIFHQRGITQKFIDWLEYIPKAAAAKNQAMAEVYEILAKHPIREAGTAFPEYTAPGIIESIYPLPTEPSTFGPREEVLERERKYELARERIITIRGEALALYQGAGTGMDHPACAGTAWGLLQSVMELEEYRLGRRVAESNLIGERQATKSRAFNLICDAIGMN